MEPDYYAILGVSPGSEDVVIQAAYRALMRRYHPDKNPSGEAASKTIEINAAYVVLGDPLKRAAYDARRQSKSDEKNTTSQGGPRNRPPPPPPPPRSKKSAAAASNDGTKKVSRVRGIAQFLVVLLVTTLISIALSGVSTTTSIANNTMNVDENLTTTDMGATDANAIDTNAAVPAPPPPDLSRQTQTAVSYSTIEDAARRFTKILTTKEVGAPMAE